MIFAVIALAVVTLGNGNVSTAQKPTTVRPQPTVSYPITFDTTPVRAPEPQPTVSYPIPWER
ncbi:hypothetical protein ACWGIN_31050 [Streptomyces sp. NPDC054861]